MKTIVPGLLLLFALLSTKVEAQLLLKVQWLQDSLAWGVFVKPELSIDPSSKLMIASGQITLVSPSSYPFKKLRNYSGRWEQNAYVHSPVENPGRDYISFGFGSDEPPLRLKSNEETLLFTFERNTSVQPDSLYLISNDDPFVIMPNSASSNPGNDLSVYDLEKRVMYSYTGNYSMQAWNPNPGKRIPQGPFRKGIVSQNPLKAIKP